MPYVIASTGRSTSQKQGKGKQCYKGSSFDLEILINHVKGLEILLASSHSLYASYALYWYSFFRLRAFFIFCCGEFLSNEDSVQANCDCYCECITHTNILMCMYQPNLQFPFQLIFTVLVKHLLSKREIYASTVMLNHYFYLIFH